MTSLNESGLEVMCCGWCGATMQLSPDGAMQHSTPYCHLANLLNGGLVEEKDLDTPHTGFYDFGRYRIEISLKVSVRPPPEPSAHERN